MILYLDASALVKRYVAEPGSEAVASAIGDASYIGTANISQTEVTAALAKAVRMRVLTPEAASNSRKMFLNEWPALIRIQITDLVIARASEFAWDHGLRGYDAVQLAAATVWADAMGEPVTLAAFDHQLWRAAENVGLGVYPNDLLRLPERGARRLATAETDSDTPLCYLNKSECEAVLINRSRLYDERRTKSNSSMTLVRHRTNGTIENNRSPVMSDSSKFAGRNRFSRERFNSSLVSFV